jgi:23S rRNA (guanosine2251-2'-O)-methyltransferase
MIYLSGFHAIEERIKSGRPCGALLVAKPGPRARELMSLAKDRKIPANRVGTSDLDRLAPDHRGIVLEVDEQGQTSEISLEDYIAGLGSRADALAVILDEITDPHNYGAILRSCDQFGADIVITRHRRTAKHADIIARTSAGASAWVQAAETANLPRAAGLLKEAGFWIYGADAEGEPVYRRDFSGRVAVILGGEGTGISRLLRESCDAIIAVPSLGRVDSLNVSVAAGVVMYEILRQRKSS